MAKMPLAMHMRDVHSRRGRSEGYGVSTVQGHCLLSFEVVHTKGLGVACTSCMALLEVRRGNV